ncbi:hypothetical protein ENTCAN_09021 [Enterobacter cancerogenus ATCC 35316]|nr:hypothetical protein ENTCAN_09021 [Enterobacter cancerogenus ATCC 35316]
MHEMTMAMRQVRYPRLCTAKGEPLQPLPGMGKITQHLQDRMLVEMDDGASIQGLCLLIHSHLVQGEGREEKQPSGTHGVVAVIDDHHAKPFFDVEDLQALMPVMVTHGIGKQTAERSHRIVQGNQLQIIGCRRVAHSAIKLNFSSSGYRYKPPF